MQQSRHPLNCYLLTQQKRSCSARPSPCPEKHRGHEKDSLTIGGKNLTGYLPEHMDKLP